MILQSNETMEKNVYIHAFNQKTGEFCVVKSEATTTFISNGIFSEKKVDIPVNLFGSEFHIFIDDDKIDKEVVQIDTVFGQGLAYVSLSDDVEKAKHALEHYIGKQYWHKTTKIERDIQLMNRELKTLYDLLDNETDTLLEGIASFRANMEEQNYELEAE